MKILSIGNSFSQDVHRKLYTLATANGLEFQTANLYIGGCTLKMHWENIQNNAASYAYEPDGVQATRNISIDGALEEEDWDVITLQQASAYCQHFSSYTPYIEKLAEYIRRKCPNAKIWFHQTWAYENTFFANGTRDNDSQQKAMFENILATSQKASESIDAPVIRAGVAIQAVRENVPEFDYVNGGMSLNRDGYHLSYDYGRFAAAYAWLYELTGVWGDICPFESIDKELGAKITKAVRTALEK